MPPQINHLLPDDDYDDAPPLTDQGAVILAGVYHKGWVMPPAGTANENLIFIRRSMFEFVAADYLEQVSGHVYRVTQEGVMAYNRWHADAARRPKH